jgi:quercetin dioxygenase-like cupin family protein
MMEEESMRVAALTLLTLILFSDIACSGSLQPKSTSGNSPQTIQDQWQPYERIPGGFRRNLIGDPRQPGAFRYQLKIPAGARVSAHRHSNDVEVKVLSGSMFIIIGEPLESSRSRRFAAGSVFVVPAQAWHEEWWDEETVLEAEGVGPMETMYRTQ